MALAVAASILFGAEAVGRSLPAAAQSVGVGGAARDEVSRSPGSGVSILGRPAHSRRLIGGMWTLHPFAVSWPRVEETYGYGVLWNGVFAATFVNSHGGRSFTAGVERVWFEPSWRFLSVGVGYRAGLVTGYDERLISWADDVPAVPFVGLQSWVRVGPGRFDVFYVYRVITLELSFGLW